MTTLGLSTWQVMTSAAGVDQSVGRLGLAHGQRPVAGEDDLRLGLRIDRLGAEGEGVDVEEHGADRLGGDEAELVGLGREAGRDAIHIVALIEIAVVAAGVLGVLVGPQAGGVAELHVGIFLGLVEHERAVVAERGREDETGAVELDHQLHGLRDRDRLGDVLLLDDLHVRNLLKRLRGDGVRLVPAVVVVRADIDDADGQAVGSGRPEWGEAGRKAKGAVGRAFEQAAAG